MPICCHPRRNSEFAAWHKRIFAQLVSDDFGLLGLLPLIVAAELLVDSRHAFPDLVQSQTCLREEHSRGLNQHRLVVIVGYFLWQRAERNCARDSQAQSALASDRTHHDGTLDLILAKRPMRVGLRTAIRAHLDAFREDAMADHAMSDFAGNLCLRLPRFAVAA